MISRQAEAALRARLASAAAVVLLGPRQVGKTTLARKLAADWPSGALYLDMERPAGRHRAHRPTAQRRRSGLAALSAARGACRGTAHRPPHGRQPRRRAWRGARNPGRRRAVLHRGFITFVDGKGQPRSLVGVIYRNGEHIELIGEHDVAEQDRLLATVMQLNDELAEQQRAVVRANRELKQQRDALDAEVARRQTAEARLLAEKEEQAALLEKLTTAQDQLLQADKMASIGQLAAGVAHEINNPIGFVSSNFTSLGEYFDDLIAIIDAYTRADTLIAREPVLAAMIRKARADCDYDFVRDDCATLLAESRDGLARVTRIVQDLRSYSRVDESIWQEADLNACVDSTLNVARHELKDKAEVVREYGTLPPVLCCPGQLNQVFMNLIINAVQALEKPGRITVRSGQVGDFVWVDVEDSGKGIAPEQVKRIFEPFFTTKPVGQGTGLGLSLCWNIVKAHGGRIDVDSQLGQGTRFRVWMPLRAHAAQAADQETQGERSA